MRKDLPPFFFLRHGETAWNYERRIQGQIDTDLNETGRMQAEAMAKRLAQEVSDPSEYRFVTSPLKRTKQTMSYSLKALGLPEDHADEDEALIELNFGEWEERRWPELNEAGVDPAMGPKGHGRHPRDIVQGELADGVGEVIGRDVLHLLVQHVDNADIVRLLFREPLDQECGDKGVEQNVVVEQFLAEVLDSVPMENGGVVNQKVSAGKIFEELIDKGFRRIRLRKIVSVGFSREPLVSGHLRDAFSLPFRFVVVDPD